MAQQSEGLFSVAEVGDITEDEGEFFFDHKEDLCSEQLDQPTDGFGMFHHQIGRLLFGTQVGDEPAAISPNLPAGAVQIDTQILQNIMLVQQIV